MPSLFGNLLPTSPCFALDTHSQWKSRGFSHSLGRIVLHLKALCPIHFSPLIGSSKKTQFSTPRPTDDCMLYLFNEIVCPSSIKRHRHSHTYTGNGSKKRRKTIIPNTWYMICPVCRAIEHYSGFDHWESAPTDRNKRPGMTGRMGEKTGKVCNSGDFLFYKNEKQVNSFLSRWRSCVPATPVQILLQGVPGIHQWMCIPLLMVSFEQQTRIRTGETLKQHNTKVGNISLALKVRCFWLPPTSSSHRAEWSKQSECLLYASDIWRDLLVRCDRDYFIGYYVF